MVVADIKAVFDLISSVIDGIKSAKGVYDYATGIDDLPTKFHDVYRSLPLVSEILTSVQQCVEARRYNNSALEVVERNVKECGDKVEKLDEILRKVIPGDNAGRLVRYGKALKAKASGKEEKVEELMQNILQKVRLLSHLHGVQAATDNQSERVKNAMQTLTTGEPSIADDEIKQAARGTVINHAGDNARMFTNAVHNNSGNIMQGENYNAQTQTFTG